MSVRAEVAKQLRDAWRRHPELAVVRVVASRRALGEIKQPTALVTQSRIGRAPEAPLSHWKVQLLLTIVSPHLDMGRAADQLDDLVVAALTDLDGRYLHDDATEVEFDNRLAYDIPLSVLAPKQTPETKE